MLQIQSGKSYEQNGTRIRAEEVTIVAGEYTLTAGLVEGDTERELVATGNPTLTYRDQIVVGDVIRFSPRTYAYRVENLHTALTPEFLQGRLLSPLYLSGESVFGRRNESIFGENIEATTCDKLRPDYVVRAREITVEPGKRIILKHATLLLWGKRIFTLPTLIFPLDQKPRRHNYTPEIGESQDEGWYVKSAFNYLLSDHAPGLFRLDLLQKKGIGTGIDQEWNLAKAAGLFALYAIPIGNANRNLSGRLTSRQNIGGGQTVTIENDFQQNSYLSEPDTTNFNTRVGWSRVVGGANTGFNISRLATDTSGFSTRSYTANFIQSLMLGHSSDLNFGADFSRNSSGGTGIAGGFGQTTEQLSTHLQIDQHAPNYALEVSANKTFSLEASSGQSVFNGVEKLPEVTLSNFRFTQGALSRLPFLFGLSVGRYSEGITTSASQGASIMTDRIVAGFDINNTRFRLTPRTDLSVSGGFNQYLYGDGAAQYVLRDSATLTQRWGGQSGLNFNYTYQRPEGGTPFRFDQLGQFHTLTADAGMLDNTHFQLTARVGYDFAQTGFGGLPAQPWQTLSGNMLIRPTPWSRVQNLFSVDPNTGKFVSFTNELTLHGRDEFSFDAVSRYDPNRHIIGGINTSFTLPIGKNWKLVGLLQYNGYLKQFESRNIEIVRDLHCMEATLTYIDNPFGYRADRQIFFQLKIKAFPIYQRFGTGAFGQALSTGLGASN